MGFFRGQGIVRQGASFLLLLPIHRQLQVSKIRAQCESESEDQGRGRAPLKRSNKNSSLPPEESCAACLYTGVATCTGLALYFAKIALLEVPDITRDMPREVASAHGRSRAGFLAVSVVWLGMGLYRWQLG